MNVKELSAKLSLCDPETEVCIMAQTDAPFMILQFARLCSTNVIGGKVFILSPSKHIHAPNPDKA